MKHKPQSKIGATKGSWGAWRFGVMAGVVALAIVKPALADGVLDTTFSSDGISQLSNSAGGNGIKVQSDGKIVVAGWPSSFSGFEVARWNPNGSLDTSWGGTGRVTDDIGEIGNRPSLAIQSDGKILVAGQLSDQDSQGNITRYFGVLRYLPNGTLDTSFSGDGVVTSTLMEYAEDITIQSDGKILVSGYVEPLEGTNNQGAVRFNADGSVDTNFGTAGAARINLNRGRATGLDMQKDGKIVVGGYYVPSGTNPPITGFVVRFNANGTLDTSFNSTGKVASTSACGNLVHDITALPDGKLILAAAFTDHLNPVGNPLVTRLNANGTPDTSFAGDGSMALDSGGNGWAAEALVDADGGIIFGGGHSLARFNSNGTLDETFGRVLFGEFGQMTGLNDLSAYVYGLALQSDGKVVVTGDFDIDGQTTNRTFVARFTNTVAPTLSITAPLTAIIEGNSGSVSANFTVSLSRAGTKTITVNYATSNGSATAGSDFTATSGTLTFSPGQTSKIIAVPVLGDTTDENGETFNLTLIAPVNANLSSVPTATGTIADDDVSLRVNNPRSLPEGNVGSPGSVTFDITLSGPSAQSVTVNYQTGNGINNPASANSDYVAKSGKLTFSPGETLKRVTIQFIGDNVVELNETFFFDLLAPTNTTISDSRGVGQINNDDGPGITIANAVTIDEGNSGTSTQTFTVTLSAASTNTVTVDWITANSTAGATDYVAASGTLTFLPGDPLSQIITVLVKGDTTVEPNETYKVALSKPTFAFLADGLGIGTIRNDDAAAPLFENDEPSE